MELQTKMDNLGGDNPIYIGESVPGTSPATARWRIQMHTYTGTDLVITAWANGSKKFDKVWDDRTTYTYITS